MRIPWSGADPGPELLNVLHGQLLVDEPFTLRDGRGFTWWPHRLRQRLTARPPAVGEAGCRLSAAVDVLVLPEAGLDAARRARLVDTLVEAMRFPALAAFHLAEERSRVVLATGLFVREATASSALPRFGVAAVMAATYAELGAARLAELTGLSPAVDAHPTSGPRPHPDDMLNLAAARVRPAGAGPSRWKGTRELADAADELAELGVRARPLPDGLDARFPFGSSGSSTALLQVRADDEHPELGRGAFLRLFLPSRELGVEEGARGELALRLNAREAADPELPLASLGAWTLESSEPEIDLPVSPSPPRLCHVTFLPSYLYVENALRNLVVEERERALWAAHALAHDTPRA